MTQTMTSIDAKEKFSELLNHVSHNKERIVITRRGKEIAALVSLDDLLFLEGIQDKHDLDEAIDALREAKNAGTISLDQLKDEIGA